MVRQRSDMLSARIQRRRRPGRADCSRVGRRPSLLLLASLILSAGVMVAATGTGRYPWLGLVALLPLFRLIHISRPSWAMLGGAIFGASICAFSAPLVPNGLVSTPGTVALLTGVCGAYAYGGAHLRRRIGYSPLVLGVGWVLVEFALHPVGLRHGLLAGTQGNGVLVDFVGRLFGYVLVAFVVAFANAWLLAILSRLRLPIVLPAAPVGLDRTGRLPWQPIFSVRPRRHLRVARPRAPPLHISS